MDATSQRSLDGNKAVRSFTWDEGTPRGKRGIARADSVSDEEKLRNRLEPYNNIAVIATLLAGFALTIFPAGLSDDLDDSDFPWGLTGHILYNVLMGISFSINLIITVMLTLQLYFTQLLVVRHSARLAMRYMDKSEKYRRVGVAVFYTVSIPTFMAAFTVLLFAALHPVAAIITSVVVLSGLVVVLLCIRSFYTIYGQALVGVISFDPPRNDGVIISRSSSAVADNASVGRQEPSSLSGRPTVMDRPTIRRNRGGDRLASGSN